MYILYYYMRRAHTQNVVKIVTKIKKEHRRRNINDYFLTLKPFLLNI